MDVHNAHKCGSTIGVELAYQKLLFVYNKLDTCITQLSGTKVQKLNMLTCSYRSRSCMIEKGHELSLFVINLITKVTACQQRVWNFSQRF